MSKFPTNKAVIAAIVSNKNLTGQVDRNSIKEIVGESFRKELDNSDPASTILSIYESNAVVPLVFTLIVELWREDAQLVLELSDLRIEDFTEYSMGNMVTAIAYHLQSSINKQLSTGRYRSGYDPELFILHSLLGLNDTPQNLIINPKEPILPKLNITNILASAIAANVDTESVHTFNQIKTIISYAIHKEININDKNSTIIDVCNEALAIPLVFTLVIEAFEEPVHNYRLINVYKLKELGHNLTDDLINAATSHLYAKIKTLHGGSNYEVPNGPCLDVLCALFTLDPKLINYDS